MGRNKAGRPSWFKLFLHHKSLIDAVPDEVAGRALKAVLRYFDTGEVVELDSLAGAVFAALKPHVDEAFEDFRRSVDTGRAGGQKRWGKETAKGDRPPIGPLRGVYVAEVLELLSEGLRLDVIIHSRHPGFGGGAVRPVVLPPSQDKYLLGRWIVLDDLVYALHSGQQPPHRVLVVPGLPHHLPHGYLIAPT